MSDGALQQGADGANDALAALPPPTGDPLPAMPPPARHERPWWGIGDILLGVPLIVMVSVIGTIVGVAFIGLDGLQTFIEDGEDAVIPPALMVCSLLGQQIGQGAWPIIVSKWKGLGPVADWGLRIKPIDPLIGIGVAFMAMGAAAVVSAIVAAIVGLTDESQADNTQLLRDAEGTPWIYVLVLAVVIGAPLSEELLFRGLFLRAIEKRSGPVVAVIGSTVLFILPHWIGAGLAGTAVLFSAIGVVGLVLAIVTIQLGRLWPAIFAHVVFNAAGAAEGLGYFDRLTAT